MSVYSEGFSEVHWLGSLVKTVGCALEDKSRGVATSGVHESTGLLLALMDNIVRGTSEVIEAKLEDMETVGALEKGHLAARSFVAEESAVKGLVPFALGPDYTSIMPVVVRSKCWRIYGGIDVPSTRRGIFVLACGSAFDHNTLVVDTPAVVVSIALEWFPCAASGTLGSLVLTAWCFSVASVGELGISFSLWLNRAIF